MHRKRLETGGRHYYDPWAYRPNELIPSSPDSVGFLQEPSLYSNTHVALEIPTPFLTACSLLAASSEIQFPPTLEAERHSSSPLLDAFHTCYIVPSTTPKAEILKISEQLNHTSPYSQNFKSSLEYLGIFPKCYVLMRSTLEARALQQGRRRRRLQRILNFRSGCRLGELLPGSMRWSLRFSACRDPSQRAMRGTGARTGQSLTRSLPLKRGWTRVSGS